MSDSDIIIIENMEDLNDKIDNTKEDINKISLNFENSNNKKKQQIDELKKNHISSKKMSNEMLILLQNQADIITKMEKKIQLLERKNNDQLSIKLDKPNKIKYSIGDIKTKNLNNRLRKRVISLEKKYNLISIDYSKNNNLINIETNFKDIVNSHINDFYTIIDEQNNKIEEQNNNIKEQNIKIEKQQKIIEELNDKVEVIDYNIFLFNKRNEISKTLMEAVADKYIIDKEKND